MTSLVMLDFEGSEIKQPSRSAITACIAPSKISASDSGMCSNSHQCIQ